MTPKVERIDEIGESEIAEGPHWDAVAQSLYFIDVVNGEIHKYVPATKKHSKAPLGK